MPVPDAWWKEACRVVNHPMACVDVRNKFVWVNEAFEKLTGYSQPELLEMTWIQITVQEDVGGDLASVNAVIAGEDDKFTISKRYRHKHGREVPVALTVWRFPRAVDETLTCFIVEALPDKASVSELHEVQQALMREIETLRSMIKHHEPSEVNVSYNSQNADRGGSNSSNNTTVLIAIAGVVVVGFIAIAALFLGGTLSINATPDGGGAVQVEAD